MLINQSRVTEEQVTFNGEIVVRERGGRRSAQTTLSMNFRRC